MIQSNVTDVQTDTRTQPFIIKDIMIYRSKGYNNGGTQKRYHTAEKPSVKRDCSGQTSQFMELSLLNNFRFQV